MSWKVVLIRAPEYIVVNDDGRVCCHADGKPDIRFSEASAARLRNTMDQHDADHAAMVAASRDSA